MIDERRAAQRWRVAVAGVAGLLLAIAVIGLVGILINRNIHQTVEEAIAFDIELEDRGDDLRVAVLEVRHYHRDLLLNNPSRPRIDQWRARYQVLLEEVSTVEAVVARAPPGTDLPDVDELSSIAQAYGAEFREVTELADSESAFVNGLTDLLPRIDTMDAIAESVDRAGEQRATASFTEIDAASARGTWVLVGVILGLGAMSGVLGYAVLRLVQDQRRLVTAEQAAAAQMAEISRAKTDFIADASHELRTPLTVLRGNAEVGLAIQDDCAHAEILGEIVAESVRMSRLVDDLLFLARSDAFAVPLEPREVDAALLLPALAGRAEMLAHERGASLSAAGTTDVEGTLRVDPDRIEQAVLVLVDNAAKYGPSGGTIDLGASARNGSLIVEVGDRGPGIPPEQVERIFERFYRVDGEGRGRPTGGVGLGLSIAAAIAEGHGGRIAALPREGGGTLMRITIPMHPASAEARG